MGNLTDLASTLIYPKYEKNQGMFTFLAEEIKLTQIQIMATKLHRKKYFCTLIFKFNQLGLTSHFNNLDK